MAKYRVGDKVEVFRAMYDDAAWIPAMDRRVGEVGVISKLADTHAVVEGDAGGFWFPLGALRKADEGLAHPRPHRRLTRILEALKGIRDEVADWYSHNTLSRIIRDLEDVFEGLDGIPPSR